MKGDVRIIKRYQNRKLYDTFQSCYVTLEEISQIIREGNEIRVIDNKTKNDITYMTQIQLLFDQERKSVSAGDTELLKRVIRAPEGTLTGYVRNLEKERAGLVEELNGYRVKAGEPELEIPVYDEPTVEGLSAEDMPSVAAQAALNLERAEEPSTPLN